MTNSALILFAHGARDPRWAAPFDRLQMLTQVHLPDITVKLAFLEIMTPRLPETIAALAAQGCTHASVVPVFLGQGGHVLRDLPELVARLGQDYPNVIVTVADAVGENPQVLEAIAKYCSSTVSP
ncbi:MAG: CbiX/SirB N-terminal domain-containing protein [Burkholderiaceae bacterium]